MSRGRRHPSLVHRRKLLAEGMDVMVLDVKVGAGPFMKTQAQELCDLTQPRHAEGALSNLVRRAGS